VIKVADHVIELGPEGGDAGGHILFAGTPEELAAQDTHTGRFLRKELARAAALADGADEELIDLDQLASDEETPEEEIEDELLDEEE